MTKDEAWRIIEACKGFNLQYWPSKLRPEEAAVLIARKEAWAKAWRVVGEKECAFQVSSSSAPTRSAKA